MREYVKRPPRRTRGALIERLRNTARNGQATRVTNSLAGYYSVLREQGYQLHVDKRGDGWLAWCEPVK